MKKALAILTGVLFVAVSCDPRLEVLENVPNIPVTVNIDWTAYNAASIGNDTVPAEATVLFFPQNGNMATPFIVSELSKELLVAEGMYDVVVMNGVLENHKDIAFSNLNDFDAFTAQWTQTETDTIRYSDFLLMGHLEDVAVREGVKVEEPELEAESDSLTRTQMQYPVLHLKPEPITQLVNVEIHVNNIHYLSSHDSKIFVENLNADYALGQSENSEKKCIQEVRLEKELVHADSSGTLIAQFYTFGHVPTSNKVNAKLMLLEQEYMSEVSFEYSLSDSLAQAVEVAIKLNEDSPIQVPFSELKEEKE